LAAANSSPVAMGASWYPFSTSSWGAPAVGGSACVCTCLARRRVAMGDDRTGSALRTSSHKEIKRGDLFSYQDVGRRLLQIPNEINTLSLLMTESYHQLYYSSLAEKSQTYSRSSNQPIVKNH
jgi:hypothetical protein